MRYLRIACFAVRLLPVGLVCLGAAAAIGQDYPGKPVRIVTSGAGGGNDFSARLLAKELAGPLGQPVIVDNRPGGVIVGEVVSQAAPDGYTLLVNGGIHWIAPLIQHASYDPVKDFSPISIVDRSPLVLVVHPSLPVITVKDLITLAKARPGALNYAAGSPGSSNNLATELFKARAGVNIVRIPYKVTGQAIIAVMAGEAQLMFSNISSVAPHVKSGRLRAVAVTSAEPWAQFPSLPTVADSGLPGFEAVSVTGIFAPAKTPASIVNRLNQEIVRVLDRPDVKRMFFDTGVEAVGSPPAALAAFIAADMITMGKVIKDAGIREE